MDVKVTRNLSVYKSTMASVKNSDKNVAAPSSDSRVKNDEIIISSDAIKKQEAAKISADLHKSLNEGASAERLSQLKGQIQDGSYQVSAEIIAKRLMSGI